VICGAKVWGLFASKTHFVCDDGSLWLWFKFVEFASSTTAAAASAITARVYAFECLESADGCRD
jgi:hypothetical protein